MSVNGVYLRVSVQVPAIQNSSSWTNVPLFLDCSTQKTNTLQSLRILGTTFQLPRHAIPEDVYLQQHHCGNLKAHISVFKGKKCPIFLQELFPGSKYKIVTENDVYKLIISNPKVDDTGKYTVEIAGISCTAYLDVEGKLVIGCNLFVVAALHTFLFHAFLLCC